VNPFLSIHEVLSIIEPSIPAEPRGMKCRKIRMTRILAIKTRNKSRGSVGLANDIEEFSENALKNDY